MKALSRFGKFWYDFVIGDDWVVAATAVVAIGATAAAVHLGWNAWPILPAAVFLSLAAAARRAVRAVSPRRPPPNPTPDDSERPCPSFKPS